MLDGVFSDFQGFLQGPFSWLQSTFPQELAGLSIEIFSFIVIGLIIVLIIIVAIVILLRKKRTPEEKHAEYIAKMALNLKKSKSKSDQNSKSSQKTATESKSSSKTVVVDSKVSAGASKITSQKTESSLKSLLIKKFQSKIESQLGSKIVIDDLSSQNENFLAHVEVAGVKLLLTLDSAGKIIDYKKIKQ